MFEENDVNEIKWWMQSGGEILNECGKFILGDVFYFKYNGERMFVSIDFDLSIVR